MSPEFSEKMNGSDPVVRIGMVNYINTAPIYEVWKKTVADERYQIVEQPPAVLNKMLASESIDLGFVSSYEYCARPEKYLILPDLSISSTGAVGSVFLFSAVPIKDLDKELILLSNQSETSVCLVKIILERFYSLQPQYIVGGVSGDISRSCNAVLAIGDDALRLVSSGRYGYQFDLGEIWYKNTGLPFVFSVCVVRREFACRYGELINDVHKHLIRCRDEGERQLADICRIVSPRIPMDCERCFKYLQALEYDLGERKRLALEKFFTLLIERREASPQSLPLQFFSRQAEKK